MKHLVRLAAVAAAVLVLSGGAYADQDAKEGAEQAAVPDWGGPHDACFGDRYETDAELNEGNEVSIDEILALINPPRT